LALSQCFKQKTLVIFYVINFYKKYIYIHIQLYYLWLAYQTSVKVWITSLQMHTEKLAMQFYNTYCLTVHKCTLHQRYGGKFKLYKIHFRRSWIVMHFSSVSCDLNSNIHDSLRTVIYCDSLHCPGLLCTFCLQNC